MSDTCTCGDVMDEHRFGVGTGYHECEVCGSCDMYEEDLDLEDDDD